MAKIGYARVSTRDQNLARQIEQLHDAGVNKIFQEKLSGKNADRPQLKAMLDYIRDDDEVVVLSLDRQSNSLSTFLSNGGISMQKRIDLANQTFGRLTVISFFGSSSNGNALALSMSMWK